jgi:hypothetical protein
VPNILRTGLIDGIISKNRSITHEELCVAVHQVYFIKYEPAYVLCPVG